MTKRQITACIGCAGKQIDALTKKAMKNKTQREPQNPKISKDKRVLVLDGFCKQCLPYIRAFRDLGCAVTVLCNSRLDCGYASRLPAEKILAESDWEDQGRTEQTIRNLICTGKYDIVVPLFDATAQLLAHEKEALSKYAYLCVNSSDIFDLAFDKNEVMRVCMERGIPCPKTLIEVNCPEQILKSDLQFPIIIKPRSMYGARGYHRFDSVDELERYVSEKHLDLRDYVIQELIPSGSKLISGNYYIDCGGEIKSCFFYVSEHIFPVSAGTSTMNGLIVREDAQEACERLIHAFGLRGSVSFDLMIDCRDDTAKIIEINLRPAHAVAIGFEAGVNQARQMLEDAAGVPVSPFSIQEPGICLRITQTDILWFLSCPDRMKYTAKKLGYHHVKDQMFFWDDPLPWFAFLISGIKDFRRKMAEKRQ